MIRLSLIVAVLLAGCGGGADFGFPADPPKATPGETGGAGGSSETGGAGGDEVVPAPDAGAPDAAHPEPCHDGVYCRPDAPVCVTGHCRSLEGLCIAWCDYRATCAHDSDPRCQAECLTTDAWRADNVQPECAGKYYAYLECAAGVSCDTSPFEACASTWAALLGCV